MNSKRMAGNALKQPSNLPIANGSSGRRALIGRLGGFRLKRPLVYRSEEGRQAAVGRTKLSSSISSDMQRPLCVAHANHQSRIPDSPKN